jgi:ABC-2 type transport system permease protein
MEGSLDVYLLQPKDVWLNVLCPKTIVSAWGDFVYGFIVLALSAGTTPGNYLMFAVLIIPGALIFTATFAAAESLSFFMGNASAISSALTEFMLSFSLYPEGIYGLGLRWTLYTIVPAGFVVFMPLRVYRAIGWSQVPWLYLVAIVYVALSYTLLNAGLRRYESGNRMDSRV